MMSGAIFPEALSFSASSEPPRSGSAESKGIYISQELSSSLKIPGQALSLLIFGCSVSKGSFIMRSSHSSSSDDLGCDFTPTLKDIKVQSFLSEKEYEDSLTPRLSMYAAAAEAEA